MGANVFLHSSDSVSHRDLGLDFVAFYRAGMLVRNGGQNELYDLEQTRQFDRALANREQLPLGEKFGPFLNPPFLAWMYAPLTMLGYEGALLAWTVISLACSAAAVCLLARMIPSADWRDCALAPALVATSLPFLQTLGHAQNACLSLLITSGAVTLWRMRRPFAAGLIGGLLIYKPQLAAVILAAMVISMGWRSLAGSLTSIAVLCLINVITLPGTLSDYIHRIGPNVQFMMATHPYIWARHATFRAFWQMLLNRSNPAASSPLSVGLAIGCAAVVGLALFISVWRNCTMASADRIIAAVIATSPLLMPYYLDYDLLLLAIPAVLLAAEIIGSKQTAPTTSRDRWLIRLWIGFYLLLLINPGLTQATGFNLSVPVLAAIATISILRIRPSSVVMATTSLDRDNFDSLRIIPSSRALAS
jgi:hypothetical protein